MPEVMTFGIGEKKQGCLCTFINGERKNTNENCGVHNLAKTIQNNRLKRCRFCHHLEAGRFHLCLPKRKHLDTRERRNFQDSERETFHVLGVKTKSGGYCKCLVDERGLISKLSFDCDIHTR
jgi:hypothetical protein